MIETSATYPPKKTVHEEDAADYGVVTAEELASARPKCISALQMYFWGMLIWSLDFNLNSVNLLPDFVGMVVTLVAIWRMGRHCSTTPYFQAAMQVAKMTMGILAILETGSHLAWITNGGPLIRIEPWLAYAWIFGISSSRTIAFAVAMLWVSRDYGKRNTASLWKTSIWISVVGAMVMLLVMLGRMYGPMWHVVAWTPLIVHLAATSSLTRELRRDEAVRF